MSRVISGWVVSKHDPRTSPHTMPWRAWKSGELPLVADTYRGILKLIRER